MMPHCLTAAAVCSQVDQIYPNPKTTAFFAQIAEEITAQDPEVRERGFIVVSGQCTNSAAVALDEFDSGPSRVWRVRMFSIPLSVRCSAFFKNHTR